MKKLFLVFAVVSVLLLALVGCGKGGSSSSNDSGNIGGTPTDATLTSAQINTKVHEMLVASAAANQARSEGQTVTSMSTTNNIRKSAVAPAIGKAFQKNILKNSEYSGLTWSGPDSNGWYSCQLNTTVSSEGITDVINYTLKFKQDGSNQYTLTLSGTTDLSTSMTLSGTTITTEVKGSDNTVITATEVSEGHWSGKVTNTYQDTLTGSNLQSPTVYRGNFTLTFDINVNGTGTCTYSDNIECTFNNVTTSDAFAATFTTTLANGVYTITGTYQINNGTKQSWTSQYTVS